MVISCGAPNGVTSNYAYDGLNRLTSLTHMAGTTTLIGNQYTYNDANNINSWTNAFGNHAYDYDLVDRLTSATNSAQPNENYSYDGVGNRTALISAQVTTTSPSTSSPALRPRAMSTTTTAICFQRPMPQAQRLSVGMKKIS